MDEYHQSILAIDFSNYQYSDWYNNVNKKMQNLESMKIDYTNLSDLEFLCQFQKLEEICCRNNGIEILPNNSTFKNNELKVLKLAKNRLNLQTINNYIENINTLETIDISENHLEHIPDSIKNQKNLIVLNCSKNKIESIQHDLLKNMNQLRYINFSYNSLNEVAINQKIDGIQHLDISHNPIKVMDHMFFHNFESLRILNISNIGLSKLLENIDSTTFFSPLQKLMEINISYNDLKEIPPSLYELTTLVRLNASHNKISYISSKIDQLIQLSTLSLSSNKLTSLPSSMTDLTNLKALYLNDNELCLYTLPDSFEKLENLETFMCAFNSLTSIPVSLCSCEKLSTLILNDNDLHTVPSEFYYLKNLKTFEYRNNPNFIMPEKPAKDNDEFRDMDFSFDNVRNMVATLLKQKFRLEAEEKERLRIQKEKDQITGGGVKDKAEIQKIMEVESKKIKMKNITELQDNKKNDSCAGSDIPVAPPVPVSLNKSFIEQSFETQVDVSSMFPSNVSTDVGIFKFQIESFHPSLIDTSLIRKFYTGDCYIVLNNYLNDTNNLQHDIYTWIGGKAPLEKMACSAMHAVNLRSCLKNTNYIIRIEQGLEPVKFLDIFGGEIEIEDGLGTKTSFISVKKQRPEPRLFHITTTSTNSFKIRRVPISRNVLSCNGVYVYDLNIKMYLWCGEKTNVILRNKIRLFLEKVIKNDRKGHGEIITVLQNSESQDFTNEFNKEALKYDNFQYVPELFDRPLILFHIRMTNGLVYINQVAPIRKQFRKEMLQSTEIYLMDCYMELYLWYGRMTDQKDRDIAYHVSCVIKESINRPDGSQLFSAVEGVESMIFKSFFTLWNDVVETNYTLSAETVTKKNENKKIQTKVNNDKKLYTHEDFNLPKIDIDPIFLPRAPLCPPNEMMNEINDLKKGLLSMEGFVLENGSFTSLDPKEIGHFYSNNCYVFLCKFSEFDETEGIAYEPSYTVFFWEGKHCSKKGWLLFSFSLQKKFQMSIKADIEIERIKQQQESQSFLGIFYKNLIYHRGERPIKKNLSITTNENESQSAVLQESYYDQSGIHMFQVRSMAEIITCRCVEIDVDAGYLSTEFAYIIVSKTNSQDIGKIFVWIGSHCDEYDCEHAKSYGERFSHEYGYELTIFYESNESDEFWEIFGGKKEYSKNSCMRNSTRLFRCTNDQGFYAIRERCADFCQIDLIFDDVMLVDSGEEVYIWIGESASSLEIKLTKKLAPIYLQQLANEKNSNNRTLKTIFMGNEPIEFKRIFQGFD